jgi:CRP/FNR family cyclic AMP-dependent transcriptional regulator
MSQRTFTEGWPYRGPVRRQPKIDLGRRLEALGTVSLFSGVPKRHLRSIAKAAHVATYDRGAVLVEEGTHGFSFFAILDGRAKVVRRGRTMARLGPGDFFGEISLLDPGPRTATVVAETPMQVLDLAGGDLQAILADDAVLCLRVLRTVARRLRETDPGPA